MTARKVDGTWIVDKWVTVPGRGRRRIREKSPIQTKKGTLKHEQRLVEQALCEAEGALEERRFDTFAQEFLENYVEVNNKYSETRTKESLLRCHLVPEFGQLLLDEISTQRVERYKAQKQRAGLSPKTINNHLCVLSKALKVAQEWGLLSEGSMPKIRRLKQAKPKTDFLSFDERDALVAACGEKWKPMVVTACNTGLRLGELLALQWKHIHLDADQPYLEVRRAAAFGRIGSPKNYRSRLVPLDAEATTLLRGHRQRQSAVTRASLVFGNPDGTLMPRHRPRYALQRICRKAGLRMVGWHVLRHTYASHMVMNGAPLATVQKLLGHGTIEMTMRYAHVSDDALFDAVAYLKKEVKSE